MTRTARSSDHSDSEHLLYMENHPFAPNLAATSINYFPKHFSGTLPIASLAELIPEPPRTKHSGETGETGESHPLASKVGNLKMLVCQICSSYCDSPDIASSAVQCCPAQRPTTLAWAELGSRTSLLASLLYSCIIDCHQTSSSGVHLT